MNFIETVRAMSGKEIIMAMVRGLQNEHVKVDMDTYGGIDLDNSICFGCAATNAVCEILGRKPNLDLMYERAADSQDDNPIFALNLSEQEIEFANDFEGAINELRLGGIRNYNLIAHNIGVSIIELLDYGLTRLDTENYKENLQQYIDYANSIKE